jgi:hypothetical protein
MSVKVAPPFKLALRIPEEGILDPDEMNLDRLRDVVLGKDTSFSRAAAIALLLRSDSPNKEHDFATVLEDEKVAGRIRYVAAITLAKVDNRAAQDILVRNLGIRDERVRAGVLIGLGRIGDMIALEAIERLNDRSKPARFAAALIAYRLGVEGHELPVPEEKALLDLPVSGARPVQWQRADAADVTLCLSALANDPFGITYAREPAYEVRCGRRQLMVLFNRELVVQDMTQRSRERKALAGVVALRNETNGTYSVSLLILTSPNLKNEAVQIMLCHTNGDIGYAGQAAIEDNSANLILRAVSRAGAFPIRFEGTFKDGRFEIKTALSALFVSSHHQPRPAFRPETPKAD